MLRRTFALLAVLSTSLMAQPVWAQPAASRQDMARSMGEEGLALFGKGQWQESFDRFQKAEELFHAPTLVLYMARCKVNLNQWLEARALYRRIDSEKLPVNASAAFVSAKKQAAEELATLMPKIPVLVLQVENAPENGVQIRLDGHETEPDRLRNGLEVDPGEHVAHISAEGRNPTTHTLLVQPAKTTRSSVALVIATEISEAIPTDNKPPAAPAAPSDPLERVDPLWVGIGAGATVAAATAGVIGVVLSNGAASDMNGLANDSNCTNHWNACLDDWDAANDNRVDYANFAVWSFVTSGVAALATGAYLGVVIFEGEEDAPKAAVVPAGPGLGGVSVTGTW